MYTILSHPEWCFDTNIHFNSVIRWRTSWHTLSETCLKDYFRKLKNRSIKLFLGQTNNVSLLQMPHSHCYRLAWNACQNLCAVSHHMNLKSLFMWYSPVLQFKYSMALLFISLLVFSHWESVASSKLIPTWWWKQMFNILSLIIFQYTYLHWE